MENMRKENGSLMIFFLYKMRINILLLCMVVWG